MNRSRTIGTKVTPEEQALLLERAAQAGMKPSDYYRSLLLGNGDRELLRTLLAEFRELRTIRLELQRATLQGIALTDDFVRRVVADAEAHRFERADRVLSRIA